MSLELKNIHKSYGKHVIFENMSFNFSYPGFYLLTGESGCGKTTLLNIIAGYEKFDKGTRIMEDLRMACIFQSYELISELTVLENIRMGVDLQNQHFENDLMLRLGLDEIATQYPDELSGGQKQRVGIARALYQNPDVVICDEPTESLDIDNKEIVLDLLKALSKDKIVIVSCHEFAYIEKYYDYHFAIQQKDLILIDQRREFQEGSFPHPSFDYHKASLKHYLHRIIHKRTLYAVICFSLLLVLQMVLYVSEMKLFTPKTTLNALNGHIAYVNLYDEEVNFLDRYVGIKKPLVDFQPVEIGTRRIKANIYPLESDQYQLKDNEILMNTLMASFFEENMVNQTLTLSYKIVGDTEPVTFIVKEIIDEADAYYPQIYYNNDWLMNELQELGAYEYFINNAKNYEIIADVDNIEKIYVGLKKTPEISASHSILDMRKQNESQMVLYQLLFRILEAIALVINVVMIIYFNQKDSQRNKSALSLMHSLQIPMAAIKKEYTRQKAIYMLVAGALISLGLIIVHELISPLPLRTLLGYDVTIVVIYLLSLGYEMLRFKKKDISMILKENKD